jgi:hypothetical protein
LAASAVEIVGHGLTVAVLRPNWTASTLLVCPHWGQTSMVPGTLEDIDVGRHVV